MIRLLMVSFVLAFTGGWLQAEEIPNPLYSNWAKFRTGTSVTQKNVVDAPGFKTETELTYELVKVTDANLTLKYSTKMTFNRQAVTTPPQEIVHTKMVTKHPSSAASQDQDYTSEKDPDETLTIGDKEITCKVSRSASKMAGIQSSTKVWMSDDVPGQTLKMESTVDQGAAGKTVSTLKTIKIDIK